MVMTQTAAVECAGLLSVTGPAEAARAQRLMRRVEIIPDNPSVRAMALRETRRVGAADKIIFGTGDQLGIPTMTSDAKFVRGQQHKVSILSSSCMIPYHCEDNSHAARDTPESPKYGTPARA